MLFFNCATVLLNFFSECSFKCCLGVAEYIVIIVLRYNLYLIYLCPCLLDLGQFLSYLCDIIFIFIVINHITSFKP